MSRIKAKFPREENDSDGGGESEVSGSERSDDLFEESNRDSDASSVWAESRSRVTTPNSSVPSSPKRRQGTEDEVPRRQTVRKGVPVPSDHSLPGDEGSAVAPRPRHNVSAVADGADPVDLEARSTRTPVL